MFICEPCHDKHVKACWLCEVGGSLMMSFGKCEFCGEVLGCYDCHSY